MTNQSTEYSSDVFKEEVYVGALKLEGFLTIPKGTRGDRLVRGEKQVKIHGQTWPVNAQIEKLDSMSAHADYQEILSWLENFNNPPRKVFVVHGEPSAAQSMKKKIKEKFGWDTQIAKYLQVEKL